MSRGKKTALIGGGLIAAAALALVVVYGFVGIEQTVTAGTQPKVCGVKVGVTASDQQVRFLGVSDESLSPGDRVRIGAFCVVEIMRIDDSGIDDNNIDEGADGAGARVQLKWRLW